jgi:hypothetical protein
MTGRVDPELIFEVIQHACGSYSANCLNASISAIGADLQEFHDNLSAALEAHYPGEEKPDPSDVHLMLFQD